jgi:histone deacetylase 6
MTRLHIFRDDISPSFEDQVLATPDFDNKRKLLFIFHDPPDLYTPSGNISTLVPAHTAQVVDGVTSYISWAVNAGFGVVDVNVPEYITPATSTTPVPYSSSETNVARDEGEKLIRYLYVNYIEPSEATSIVLMGVGNAFHAIAKLLSDSEVMYMHISGVIGFISVNPVRPVGGSSPYVTAWYRNNSLIYVAETHALWKKAKEGKVSKRYGDIRIAQGNASNDIMIDKQDEVEDWILGKVHDDDETEDEESEDVERAAAVKSEPGIESNGLAVAGVGAASLRLDDVAMEIASGES